jgi:hypothetical protein
MAATKAEALATCNTSGDDCGLSFDDDCQIDEVEYARIMHRIGVDGDETVTHVSAFNSSI